MTPDAPHPAAPARVFGVVGGLGRDPGEEPGRGRGIEPVHESGLGSRVQRGGQDRVAPSRTVLATLSLHRCAALGCRNGNGSERWKESD